MRWRGGVLKPPDQERKKRLQRPASLEIRRLPGADERNRFQLRKAIESSNCYGQSPSTCDIQKHGL